MGDSSIFDRTIEKGQRLAKDTVNCLWCATRLKHDSRKIGGQPTVIPFYCSPQCAITWAVAMNIYAREVNLESALASGSIDLTRPIIDLMVLDEE